MSRCPDRACGALAAVLTLSVAPARPAYASDHLDTPTVVADPAADVGDLFAWISPDGAHLDLVMTIVGAQFSDRVLYVFHVDSAGRFGAAAATTTTITCRFSGPTECWLGDADHAVGDATKPDGVAGKHGRFRVFAGLRDDPFFNNVKGTRSAIDAAVAAIAAGLSRDPAGCAALPPASRDEVLARWRQTEGGPATNLLAGWRSAALVVSVDLAAVTAGGPLLAVWGGTYRP